MIRVAIVDDHQAVRLGLHTALHSEPGLIPVGSAAGRADLEPLLYRTAPDVVLLDYYLDGEDGLTVCRRLKSAVPAPAVVLYSAYADPSMIVRRSWPGRRRRPQRRPASSTKASRPSNSSKPSATSRAAPAHSPRSPPPCAKRRTRPQPTGFADPQHAHRPHRARRHHGHADHRARRTHPPHPPHAHRAQTRRDSRLAQTRRLSSPPRRAQLPRHPRRPKMVAPDVGRGPAPARPRRRSPRE